MDNPETLNKLGSQDTG